MSPFETFDHTADIGLRVTAANLSSLFEDAGRGFYSLIIDNIDAIQLRDERSFSLSSGSLEMLYLNWLNELLFCFETELLVLTDFEIHLSDHHLTGTARGEVLDIRRHQTHFNVKAITYHQLQVSRTHQGWLAEVILDIYLSLLLAI